MAIISQPSGDPFIVNPDPAGFQEHAKSASLTNGYVIAWRDVDDTLSNHRILARMYDADGTPGPAFEVLDDTSGLVPEMSIVALSDGGFVLFQTSFGVDGSVTGIEGQRVDASGTLQGDPFTVNATTNSLQQYPDAVLLSSGNLAVVWDSFVFDDRFSYGIAAQVLPATGPGSDPDIVVNTTTENGQTDASIAALTTGGFVVAWVSAGQNAGVDGIYAQRFDSSGAKVGAEFLVSAEPGNVGAATPEVVALPDGGFAVFFKQSENTPGLGFTAEIAGRFYASDGTLVGSQVRVDSIEDLSVQYPSATQLSNGDVLVMWHSSGIRGSAHPPGLYVQRFSPTGEKIGGEVLVSDEVLLDSFGHYLTALPDGSALATWTTSSGSGPVWDEVSAQLLTSVEVSDGPEPIFLVGTPGADTLDGGAANDSLEGLAGNDLLRGFEGNDSMDGGLGADTLNGGDGDDIIIGGPGEGDLRDVIFAGEGNDSVDAGAGNDQVFGQGGNDTIAGGFGVDEIQGQDGDDVITGSAFSDLVFGGAGNDFVNGGFGHDRINGGDGADKFFHVGVEGHGSDWVQDYSSAEGDVLLFGNTTATRADFQVNFAHTENAEGERAGDDAVQEAFVIYRPTGQIMWALVDGAGQDSINLQIGAEVFDLLA
ncbi:calcium-binding protein [Ruegeria aquimaris]|uniref:Hemolysin, chromosomal n=1 Tax=Ruegeria aquimaris TaxID=2984333 RepID=A0ABT3AIE6_9RHOB|nr:calcium-binding protein [Ruegeria sp. XHP0148]MCV2888450.1 hypothetical protein [Ruegeria sp. XHP0148]